MRITYKYFQEFNGWVERTVEFPSVGSGLYFAEVCLYGRNDVKGIDMQEI